MLEAIRFSAVAPPPLTETPAAPPIETVTDAVVAVAKMSALSLAVTPSAPPPVVSRPTPVT